MSSPKLRNLAAKALTAEQLRNFMYQRPAYRSNNVVALHPYTAVARLAALRGALRKAVRRRKAIIKHFEHRTRTTATQPLGFRGRLKGNLFQAKMTAHARLTMTPEAKRRSKLRALRLEAGGAYWNYAQQTSANNRQKAWNRFLRIHIKAGGRPNITWRNARSMYN